MVVLTNLPSSSKNWVNILLTVKQKLSNSLNMLRRSSQIYKLQTTFFGAISSEYTPLNFEDLSARVKSGLEGCDFSSHPSLPGVCVPLIGTLCGHHCSLLWWLTLCALLGPQHLRTTCTSPITTLCYLSLHVEQKLISLCMLMIPHYLRWSTFL